MADDAASTSAEWSSCDGYTVERCSANSLTAYTGHLNAPSFSSAAKQQASSCVMVGRDESSTDEPASAAAAAASGPDDDDAADNQYQSLLVNDVRFG